MPPAPDHTRKVSGASAELIHQQRPEEAISLLRRLHEADPDDISFCWRLGRALFVHGQALQAPGSSPMDAARAAELLEEAEHMLAMALAAQPQYSPVAVLRADLLLDADPAAALALLEQADPAITTPLLWEAQARALRANDRAAETDELCTRLRALDAHEIAEQLEPLFPINYPRAVFRILQVYMDGREPSAQERILSAGRVAGAGRRRRDHAGLRRAGHARPPRPGPRAPGLGAHEDALPQAR